MLLTSDAKVLRRLRRRFLFDSLAAELGPLASHTNRDMQPSPPRRFFCDFNRLVETDTYDLNTVGSRADVAKASITPMAGLAITVYDADKGAVGEPLWLVAEATVVNLPSSVLGAQVNTLSWRHELRTTPTHDA